MNELMRYTSTLDHIELRMGLKARIRFLGTCSPRKFSGIKDSISRCARLYARLKGVEPHNNGKLQIVRSLKIKRDWRTNPDYSYRKEIKRC